MFVILDAASPILYLFSLFRFTRLCLHPLVNPATFLC